MTHRKAASVEAWGHDGQPVTWNAHCARCNVTHSNVPAVALTPDEVRFICPNCGFWWSESPPPLPPGMAVARS